MLLGIASELNKTIKASQSISAAKGKNGQL